MAIADTLPTGWVLAALMLSACTPLPYTVPASTPTPHLYVPPDTQDSGTSDTATVSVSIDSPLNLNQTVQRALEIDPQIRSGLETVHQSLADLLTARLPPNPTANISSTLMPLGQSFTPNRQGGPPQFDAGLSFPVDWFVLGKQMAAVAVAQGGVAVAQADFADWVRRRVSAVVANFYDVLEAEALEKLAREDLADLSELARITANRVEIGGVGSIELDRIRLSIFSSRRELRSRETAVANAKSRLQANLGLTDTRPLSIRGSLDVVQPQAPLTLDSAVSIALDNRPDLQSSRLNVQRTSALITSEQRKGYPQITPAIGYTRQFQQQAIGYPDASSFGVGVNFSVPLFDRNQGNIARAQSLNTQAELDQKTREVALKAEVEQTLNAYKAAFETLSTDDPGQLEAARTVRDKIRAAYELGGKTLIEVMDAQRTYRETYRLHIAGRSDYWHSFHALNAALAKQVLQ
ncbi:MAG: TolC family protein [Methylococcaceae bacterium]